MVVGSLYCATTNKRMFVMNNLNFFDVQRLNRTTTAEKHKTIVERLKGECVEEKLNGPLLSASSTVQLECTVHRYY